VQDEGGAEVLAEWGCDYLQGMLIGRATLAKPWESGAANAAAR
jgi:EAL domain-containing protein (putative c-di-GMP-specific phosphodiesterase class I)